MNVCVCIFILFFFSFSVVVVGRRATVGDTTRICRCLVQKKNENNIESFSNDDAYYTRMYNVYVSLRMLYVMLSITAYALLFWLCVCQKKIKKKVYCVEDHPILGRTFFSYSGTQYWSILFLVMVRLAILLWWAGNVHELRWFETFFPHKIGMYDIAIAVIIMLYGNDYGYQVYYCAYLWVAAFFLFCTVVFKAAILQHCLPLLQRFFIFSVRFFLLFLFDMYKYFEIRKINFTSCMRCCWPIDSFRPHCRTLSH